MSRWRLGNLLGFDADGRCGAAVNGSPFCAKRGCNSALIAFVARECDSIPLQRFILCSKRTIRGSSLLSSSSSLTALGSFLFFRPPRPFHQTCSWSPSHAHSVNQSGNPKPPRTYKAAFSHCNNPSKNSPSPSPRSSQVLSTTRFSNPRCNRMDI